MTEFLGLVDNEAEVNTKIYDTFQNILTINLEKTNMALRLFILINEACEYILIIFILRSTTIFGIDHVFLMI